MRSGFKYELDARVTLRETSKTGTVVGRAEYLNEQNSYYVRYAAADGRQQKCWWTEGDLAEIGD